MGPLYSVVGMVSTIAGGLLFGRPYSPAYLSTCGFILNFFVTRALAIPGLFDWLDKCISLVAVALIFIEYFYRFR
jgi:hypothetical protein